MKITFKVKEKNEKMKGYGTVKMEGQMSYGTIKAINENLLRLAESITLGGTDLTKEVVSKNEIHRKTE